MSKESEPTIDHLIDSADTHHIAIGQNISWHILSSAEIESLEYYPNGRYSHTSNFAPLSNLDVLSAIHSVMNYLDQVLSVDVSRTSDFSSSSIRFGEGVIDEPLDRYAGEWICSYHPGVSGELYLEEAELTASDNLRAYIVLHEVLHALDLEHPEDDSADGYRANEKYTVMSYNYHPSFTGSDDDLFYPQTLMLDDLLALQALGWNLDPNYDPSNPNTHVIKFADDQKYLETIYIGSTADQKKHTFSAENDANAVTLDLREGYFSSVGEDGAGTGRAVQNVAIAYGTIIADAIGGNGNDTLIGNVYNNMMDGGKKVPEGLIFDQSIQ